MKTKTVSRGCRSKRHLAVKQLVSFVYRGKVRAGTIEELHNDYFKIRHVYRGERLDSDKEYGNYKFDKLQSDIVKLK